MPYVPTNADVFSLAFNAASAGMAQANRVSQNSSSSVYDGISSVAGAFAQQFDVSWGSATALTEPQALAIQSEAYGFFSNRLRQPSASDLVLATWAPYIAAMIAIIVSNDNYLAGIGFVPPTWGGGGGGGGGGAPNTPANSIGFLLTSTNNTGGALPAASSSDWEPSGGFSILTYAKTHGSLFEVGNTDTNPQFNQTYNEAPDSAQIVYTQQPGSPLILIAPFTTGTIIETFTSAVSGATASFQLQATKGASTKTSTLLDTWALPFLSLISATGAVAATQAFLDAMRAANGAQLHTARAGTYLSGQNVGAGQISCIATPTVLGAPTFKDINGFVVAPVFVGTVGGYTNPFAVGVSMDLYTVGGVGVGVVAWTES